LGQLSQSVPKNSSNFAPSFRNEWRCVVLECIELSRRGAFPATRESLGLGTQEALHQAEHKLFAKMKEKNYEVIDQMYSAMLSQNESEELINALRPQVEEAVEELIAERGLPKSFTGTILYHGFKIRVQRPTSYTWEKNNNIQDDRLAYYKEQHALYLQLQRDCKHLRADIKHTGDLLAEDYPDSQSIKHGLTVALMK